MPSSTATRPSCGSSSAPGIQRADLVIAVTGDDEDNILICQVAKEKYGVERIVARVNNPRNLHHFKLLGIQPAVSATDLILRLIEHEVPEYGLVQLLALEEEHLEIIEIEVARGLGRGRPQGLGGHAPRRLADHLGAARRRRLRAQGRLGDPGRRPGAADPRSRPRGRDHAALLRQRRRATPARRRGDSGRRMADGGQRRVILLVGGGLAAGNCARWLRRSGADGSILLVGREPDLPYDRPPLSKGYLRGTESVDDALMQEAAWYAEQEIEALTRVSAMKLDLPPAPSSSPTARRSASVRRCWRPAPTSGA